MNWSEISGWFAPEECALAQQTVREAPPGPIVELGTWAGRSLACLAETGRRPITSYDVYHPISQAVDAKKLSISEARSSALKVASEYGVTVTLRNSILAALDWHPREVAAILVDDHHERFHIEEVIREWLPIVNPLGAWMFHDYGGVWAHEVIPATRVLVAEGWTLTARAKDLAVFKRSV